MLSGFKHIALISSVLLNVVAGFFWHYPCENQQEISTVNTEEVFTAPNTTNHVDIWTAIQIQSSDNFSLITKWQIDVQKVALPANTLLASNAKYLLQYQAQVLAKIPEV